MGEDKQTLRKRILSVRDGLDPARKAGRDDVILGRVLEDAAVVKAHTVLTYVSFRSEVDTRILIGELLRRGIRVAVPRVEDDDISFYLIGSWTDLADGYMGIPEPVYGCEPWKPDPAGGDVLIVPGSVFDEHNHRIGYGGGYYDRFLSRYPDIYSIGIAYGFQMTGMIPADEWDQPLDKVITDVWN